MDIGLLFWLLALLACGYAGIAGGKDGRWAAGLILAASILTYFATIYGKVWGSIEVAVFAVDAVLLIGLYLVMVGSRRWWPIWMTGFHFIAVLTHISTLLAPGFVPTIYFFAASFWAIPVLLSMVIGVARDQRAARRRKV